MTPPCVGVVRLLLEAGADPALASEDGAIPLYLAAEHGDIELVDMLYSSAPAVLNHCTAGGLTPLFAACSHGHETAVSHIIALGAKEPMPPFLKGLGPLGIAVMCGFVGVVRVLISKEGVRAAGGNVVIPGALHDTIRFRQAAMLRLPLTVGGTEKKSEWANIRIKGNSLLHLAAIGCHPAAVSVLLGAGADDATHDPVGRTPRDMTWLCPEYPDPRLTRPEDKVAIRRMLDRGPAYRALSWVWPLDDKLDIWDGVGGDTDSAVASASLCPPNMTTPIALGLRIFRLNAKSTNKRFGTLIDR